MITKEILQDIYYQEIEGFVSDDILDHSRWSINKRMVFAYNGKFYSVDFSVGATESQDEEAFEYGYSEPIEVELKEVLVEQWVPVCPNL